MIHADTVFNNGILRSLPERELEMLLPHLEPIELEQRKVLYDVGEKFEYIYFLEYGVNSILATMEDGTTIEMGMVGFEGLTPLAALLGDEKSQQQNVIQLPGHGHRIKISHSKAAFENGVGMRTAVLKFANSLLHLGAQTAACNRLHAVEKRLARWLLMSQDRFMADIPPLTQEYISSMLGVCKVGITPTAAELQRSGIIHYNRGHITIIDRVGLEKCAYECYAIDKTRFLALIQNDTDSVL